MLFSILKINFFHCTLFHKALKALKNETRKKHGTGVKIFKKVDNAFSREEKKR